MLLSLLFASFCYYHYYYHYYHYLALAGNNELFRVTPPHLLDDTDTLYLGDQHWQLCWFFLFFFLVSTCLSLCQSVCVSVRLKQIYVNLSWGLELKKSTNYVSKHLEILPKNRGGSNSIRLWVKTVSSKINICLFYWTCDMCIFCLASFLCRLVWLWTTTFETYVRFFWRWSCDYNYRQYICDKR